jgi:exopolysaccharide biosynthesis predicted pyruvyltransferase EpsI
LDSILEQSYKDIEILLVDDGSTDDSGHICDDYASKNDNIRVIHKENGGLSSARNAALDVASGDYIGFVDSDDYIHPKMFEKLLLACESNDADISTCCHYVEKGDSLLIEGVIDDNVHIYGSEEALELLIRDEVMKSYAWDKLYKAELFEGVRYPNGRNYEDVATTYLLFDRAGRICYIPEYLYYYQMREGSISAHISDSQWHKNCGLMILSQKERFEYFFEKNQKIATLSLAMMVKYIYSYMDTGSALRDTEGNAKWRSFLLEHEEDIKSNPYVSDKDKKLLKIYTMSDIKLECYRMEKKPAKSINEYAHKAKRFANSFGLGLDRKYDFGLDKGKTTRLILFELPCFDNLGDHAIAYAGKQFLEDYTKKNPEMQLFIIDGWDTVDAINQLKKEIAPEDIIFCQGGGNIGNLYSFAEVFRNKVLMAFPRHRIIIFPQTIYFTQDEEGEKARIKSIGIYSKCQRLTICARDNSSYNMMKEYYGDKVEVIEMNDIVSYLDESQYGSTHRDKILLCLRSDKESALTKEDKKLLQSYCEGLTDKLLVTDTVMGADISKDEREKVLDEKWKIFGGSRLVVTDRLHGMIFSLITKTPCVVLGNNHHKVKSTYETFKKCEYLYYADSVRDAREIISEVLNKNLPINKMDIGKKFSELEAKIVSCN